MNWAEGLAVRVSSTVLDGKDRDSMGEYSDLMGFIVVQWDINGIYPLVICNNSY